jgi:transposase-like protein
MSEAGFGGLAVLVFLGLVYIGTPILADNRGRNWKLWLVLTFCLPIIAPIILLLLPVVHRGADNPARSDEPEGVPTRNNSSKKTAPLSASSVTNAGAGASDKLQKKSYTEEFKKEVASTALTSGETLSSVAAMYDISPTLVRNWKEKYEEEVLAALNSKGSINDGANMNDNSDHNDDTAVTPTLIWHIDRAKFSFSDPSEYKEWKKEKKVFFEFSPTGADDGGEAVFVDPDSAEGDFEVTEGRGTIKVKLEKDGPVITAWVGVDAETVDGLDEDTLSEWANDQGGWASCSIHLGDFDASIEEDDGGDWRFPGNEDN